MNQHVKNKLDYDDKKYLEHYFEFNRKPSDFEKNAIARKLDVSYKKISNWFQNRRAKEKNDAVYDEDPNAATSVYPQCNSLYIKRNF